MCIYSVFIDVAKQFSKVVVHNLNSHHLFMKSAFCFISFASRIVNPFHFSHCSGCVFHSGFNCISLMTDVVEHLFMTLLVLWISSFVKNLFKSFAYVCQVVACVYLIDLPGVLFMFWIQVLSQTYVLQIYSPTLWLTFSLSMLSFDEQKFFKNFNMV